MPARRRQSVRKKEPRSHAPNAHNFVLPVQVPSSGWHFHASQTLSPRERAEKCRNSSGWHFHASQGCRASRREAIQASVFGRTLPGIERLPLGISSKIQQNTIIVRGLSVAGQNECCRRFYPAQPRDSVWATEHPETTQSTWTNNAYPPRCPTSAPDRSRSSVSGALLVIRSAAP